MSNTQYKCVCSVPFYRIANRNADEILNPIVAKTQWFWIELTYGI